MSLTQADVLKIAKLSRLKIDDRQTSAITNDLNSIFNWIEQLQEVDVEDVPAMAGVGDNIQRLRHDEVTDGNIKDKVLSNAPKSAFDCYVVPKVVE